jgi:predicted lactoylglutathione lyase
VEQRITLVTLGVSDYERAKAFYEALGWSAALEVEETTFFQGNGVILALWGREKLGPDIGIPDDGARWSGIALAHNVRSPEKVHEVIEQARKNGAEITREPADTFYGGYAGAFRDLDGQAWEIAHNQASAWTAAATSSFLARSRSLWREV